VPGVHVLKVRRGVHTAKKVVLENDCGVKKGFINHTDNQCIQFYQLSEVCAVIEKLTNGTWVLAGGCAYKP
jgi:hypothetical protein